MRIFKHIEIIEIIAPVQLEILDKIRNCRKHKTFDLNFREQLRNQIHGNLRIFFAIILIKNVVGPKCHRNLFVLHTILGTIIAFVIPFIDKVVFKSCLFVNI